MKTDEPYTQFSRVYDLMGADQHSAKMVAYTFSLFRKFGIRVSDGLDLCCGTGTAIALFLDQGVHMAGLDKSASMLAVAEKKLAGRGVELFRMALPNFRIEQPQRPGTLRTFELVTCFYDSLNYLKNARELKSAFRSVYRHLTPGGWFIFDMNTPDALKVIWDSQTSAHAQEDLAWIWENSYQKRTNTATLRTTFFVRRGKLWERFDEEHVERAYDNALIRRLLKEVGFRIKGFYRCFTFQPPGKKTYRICGVVRKP